MSRLLALAALLMVAQVQAGPPPAAVSVDFIASTSAGDPVGDLTAADVTLRVDGKVRQLQSLRFVRLERGSVGAEAVAASARLPPLPYGTNLTTDAGVPSRTLVIVIEDESLQVGREKAMRDATSRLLSSLASRDRVALVTVPHGGLRVDFTTDHLRVREALWQIGGQAERTEAAEEASCRTRNTVHALTGLLDDLAGGDGPTTVLFFSSGLVGLSPMTLTTPGVAGETQPVVGRCLIEPDLFQHLGSAAEAARANFYIVPFDTEPISPRSLEGIEHVAGVTGGTRLGMASGAETAFARIERETSGYWVATFTPDASERNGLSHRIDVRVARPGVTVRTRPGIFIPGARADAAAASRTTAREILQEGRTHRELPLRVAGFASRQRGDSRLRIVALAEAFDSTTKLASVSIGLLDGEGKLVAQWNARDEELSAPQLQAALLASPGSYRLRAAATDASGRRGTADFSMDATLTAAGPLQLSSLVVGLSRDGRFLPRLEFGAEASAVVQLEIYGGTPGMAVGTLLDVSDGVNGKPLIAMRLVVEGTSEPDRFIAKGTIPIGALPAGDFVARATVEIQGQPAGRVVRTIRKK
jgi:VWFA-related protein